MCIGVLVPVVGLEDLRGVQNCGVKVSYKGGVLGGEQPLELLSLSLPEHEGGVGGKKNPETQAKLFNNIFL